jgi:hypothetical protein
MLRWHYRSRYPELIAFSNHEFYGDGLVLFPHPGTEHEGDGINFRAVEDGVYATSLNPREAEAIVDAVRAHATRSPERSLMVVTMNQPQRELVDTLVQNAEKDDPVLAAFRQRHEGTLEPFAVKNLENVQGDERDTIFVGVTYGPNERGTLAQHFGPINAMGGERRSTCCSRAPSSGSTCSARSIRRCCASRRAARAGSACCATICGSRGEEPRDGPLHGARSRHRTSRSRCRARLRAHGYEVHPQVGVAGYYLDLAVVGREPAGPLHPRHRVRRRDVPLRPLGARPRPAAAAGAAEPRLGDPPHLVDGLVPGSAR